MPPEALDGHDRHRDVLVVGAGISGIAAGYFLRSRCPSHTYAILEGRPRLGGTWDLFRYPGLRSDSDMYTLGFSFRPWAQSKAIADGSSILTYLRDTAEIYGIDRNIELGQRVTHASWSSDTAQWTVNVQDGESGRTASWTCRFLLMCSGYYDYGKGYTPEFQGRERFRGLVIHPQQWPSNLDCAGKRVVVIGSGATAVTLVPALAKSAAHVTMLQRSPTYIVSAPDHDRVAGWLEGVLPLESAYAMTRWKNVLMGMATFALCRRYPEPLKKILVGRVKKQIGASVDVKHFTPTYKPWDQRICLVPDGDLFESIASGTVSVVTDRIETFTETGLRLQSGTELAADVIVTATGLNLQVLGGATLDVDGVRVEPDKVMSYKGMMWSGVPNFALSLGYTNASWTLKAELTSEYVCRLLRHMKTHGYAVARPRRDPSVEPEPLIDFTSGYVRRSIDALPRQGASAPWKLYQNYALDRMTLRHARIADGVLQFS